MSRISKIGKQVISFKWILLFGTATILVSCSNINERKNFGLNGNVKSYFVRLYEAEKKFGKWENGDIEYYGHSRVTFDSKGLYQEIGYYDDDMDLTGKLLPIREKGKVIQEEYYDGDGDLQSKTVIKHISKNERDFETFNLDGKRTTYGKTIIKNGKVTKTIYTSTQNSNENETHTTLFEYDKHGNLISQKQINKKGEINSYLRFEYLELDTKKNWTKRLMYKDDDEPENIAIREIEYY